MRYLLLLAVLASSCATPCPICECEPVEVIDCEEQITDVKIRAAGLLGECQSELRKYKK